jgi:hypothetical protein
MSAFWRVSLMPGLNRLLLNRQYVLITTLKALAVIVLCVISMQLSYQILHQDILHYLQWDVPSIQCKKRLRRYNSMREVGCLPLVFIADLLEKFEAITLLTALPHNAGTTNIYCAQYHDNDYTAKHEECLQSVCPDNSLQASLYNKTSLSCKMEVTSSTETAFLLSYHSQSPQYKC